MPTLASLINSVIISLSLLAPGGIVVLGQGQTQTQGQSDIAGVNVFVVSSATKTHQLDLQGIEGESPTQNFVIKPESVVQVNQSGNLLVFTQPINQVIESVKVQDANGVLTTLPPLGNNAFSLAGLPTGAYILDVIVDLGSGKKGAYETILVVLQQGQQPIQPAQVINSVQISQDIRIIFNGDNGNDTGVNQTDPEPPPINQTDPEPPPEECEPGYELVGDNCEPIVCPEGSQLDSNNICKPLPDPDPDPPVDDIPDVPDDGQGGEDNDSGNGSDQPDDPPEDDSSDDQGSDQFFE